MRKPRTAAEQPSYGDLRQMAGYIDGEGSINLPRNKRGGRVPFVRINVTGTSTELADWLLSKFGGDLQWRNNGRKKNWKNEFFWRLSHRSAVDLLERVEKWLVVKWPQACLAIALDTIKNLAREDGKIISLGYRKSCTFDTETHATLTWITDKMKLFNLRGKSRIDPWQEIEAMANGSAK